MNRRIEARDIFPDEILSRLDELNQAEQERVNALIQELQGFQIQFDCIATPLSLPVMAGFFLRQDDALAGYARVASVTAAQDQNLAETLAELNDTGLSYTLTATSVGQAALQSQRLSQAVGGQAARRVMMGSNLVLGAAMTGIDLYEAVESMNANRQAEAGSAMVAGAIGGGLGGLVTGPFAPITVVAGAISGATAGYLYGDDLAEQTGLLSPMQALNDARREEQIADFTSRLEEMQDRYQPVFEPALRYRQALWDWNDAFENQDTEALVLAERRMQLAFEDITQADAQPAMSQADIETVHAIQAACIDQFNALEQLRRDRDDGETLSEDDRAVLARIEQYQQDLGVLFTDAARLLHDNNRWFAVTGSFQQQFSREHRHLMEAVFPCIREELGVSAQEARRILMQHGSLDDGDRCRALSDWSTLDRTALEQALQEVDVSALTLDTDDFIPVQSARTLQTGASRPTVHLG